MSAVSYDPLSHSRHNAGDRSTKVGHAIIVTDILSRAVSDLPQLIVQILDTLHFEPLFGWLGDNVRCSSWAHWKVRSGPPISVN